MGEAIPCELCDQGGEGDDEDLYGILEGARSEPMNDVDAAFSQEGKQLAR